MKLLIRLMIAFLIIEVALLTAEKGIQRLQGAPPTTPDSSLWGAGQLAFVENLGQFDQRARFLVLGASPLDGTIWLTENAIWMTMLPVSDAKGAGQTSDGTLGVADTQTARTTDVLSPKGVTLKLSFEGANWRPDLQGLDQLDTRISYFSGAGPGWYPDVPLWGRVRYRDLYPGVDLEAASEAGRIGWRLMRRTSDWSGSMVLRVEGVEDASLSYVVLDQSGAATSLQLSTEASEYSLPLPAADFRYQVLVVGHDGSRVEFDIDHAGRVHPSWVDRQPNNPVDNPTHLLYGTFVGGMAEDNGLALAVDANGRAYVAGFTLSTDFPVSPGAFDPGHNGQFDVFVVRLNTAGSSLEYATFLGGAGDDFGIDIAVDSSNRAYVAGFTQSNNFPTTPGAYDRSPNGGFDGFAVRLNTNGTALEYATYFGGMGDDHVESIAVDTAARLYVSGYTSSSNFPTTPGAFDPTFNGATDVFALRLNSAGSSLDFSTYVGGSNNDSGYAIAIDAAGRAYLAGQTESSNFPVTANAYDRTYNGNGDAFVVRLDAAGGVLGYASFVGGSGLDYATGIAVDSNGRAHVSGSTASTNFPVTSGAFDTTHNGASDAFLLRVSATGSGLDYASFLGGSGNDYAFGVALGNSGMDFVVGSTSSDNFPITANAFDTSRNGADDAFLVAVDSVGNMLTYGTYLGSNGNEAAYSVAVDSQSRPHLAGQTTSAGFPTTSGAFDTTYNGVRDAFVVKLLALQSAPTPTDTPTPTRTSTSTPGATSTPTPSATSTPTPTATPSKTTSAVRLVFLPVLVKAPTPSPTPTTTATPTPVPAIVNGGFEGGLTGWTSGGSYAQPQARTDVVRSGARSAVLGNPDEACSTSTNPRRGDSWVSQIVRVPNTNAPRLEVWYRIFTWDRNSALSDQFDRFEIWLNNSRIHRDANTTANPGCGVPPIDLGWKRFIYDLSAYRGQQVTLKLSNVVWPDEAFNTWTFVDDVQIVP